MNKTHFYPLAYLFLIILLGAGAGCKKHRYNKFGETEKIEVDGKKRLYVVYTPEDLHPDSTYSLILALHGRFGDPANMAESTHLNETADFKKFIVCYPEGIERSWADSRETSPASEKEIDDIAFLDVLIDQLIQDYPINSKKVYAVGLSNGGFMVQDMACKLSEKIAAFTSVIASTPLNLPADCSPTRSVPCMFILGTEDPLIPYAGGEIPFNEGGQVLSADSSIQFWLTKNGCTGNADSLQLPDPEDDGCTITQLNWNVCNPATGLTYLRVNGGGHNWPGGEPIWSFVSGNHCKDIDASIYIWEFLSQYSLP